MDPKKLNLFSHYLKWEWNLHKFFNVQLIKLNLKNPELYQNFTVLEFKSSRLHLINWKGSFPKQKYIDILIYFPWVIFCHYFKTKNTGPKILHTPLTLFHTILVQPLSDFGCNLLMKSQHVWKLEQGLLRYAERVFKIK